MIEIKEINDVAVVGFVQKITKQDINKLAGVDLSKMISDATGKVKIVLNLEKIDYLDSAGLGAIMLIFKDLHSKSGALALCCANGKIINLINMLTVNKVIKDYITEEEAIKSFST